MNKALHAATKKSWTRAKALHGLTEMESSTPAVARRFLSNNPQYQESLDGKADKRNPKVREALAEYEKFCGTNPKIRKTRRPAKGDPTKEVRAGAPTRRRKTGGRPRVGTDPGKLSADVLFDLRALQRKHQVTLDEILYCCKVLGDLCDSPIDADHFIKTIKG